jgi:PKD repeat protein
MKTLLLLFLVVCGWLVFTISSACGKKEQPDPCAGKTTPTTDFYAEKLTVNPGDWVNFLYCGSDNVETFAWSFPGSTTPTSTSRFCTVIYATVGTYGVSLKASNSCFSDTRTKDNYIHVIPYTDGKSHKPKKVTIPLRNKD